MVTVLMAGGGTGGHVFPLMAVGHALERDKQADVVYVGTERGLETKAVPAAGGRLELLDVRPLRGAGLSGALRGAVRAAAVLPEAAALVRRLRPDAVLSVGGYAAGPVSLAARTMGIPLAVMEPNSALGFANRLLAPLASRAYIAFGPVERHFRRDAVRRLGVPLRPGFAPSSYEPVAGPLSVLVLGGSLGARALNRVVPEALTRLVEEGRVREIVHQSGRAHIDETRAAYAGRVPEGIALDVTPFIADVPAALKAADVVIQRAGASSVAELCAIGRPALLIPFPFAADQHQHRNAEALEAEGAARLLEERVATVERIADFLRQLADSPAKRASMAAAARALGKPDAATDIANDLLSLTEGGA